jgi:SAM-dependent methyltransferase
MKTADSDFAEDAFSRFDESDDAAFYTTDRFVSHLDSLALATVVDLIEQLVTQEQPEILDLMASWDSHLPDSLEDATVVGLGLNQRELDANRALTERVLHDLNAKPALPFSDRRFDVVLCTVSVDYLTRPIDVFREVARVLKPGGFFLVVFSNRYFPPKVVKIWREANEAERVELVKGFFDRSGGFARPRVFTVKGRPRPADDPYSAHGLPSDPICAVFADREGGSGVTRELPESDAADDTANPGLLQARKHEVANTLRCPHCENLLCQWLVPQTPFVEWSSTYQFICFNDQCPHYVLGWEVFAKQGIPGSYRFMYDPDSGGCHSVPVLTPTALRASIVSAEDSHDSPGIC